MQATPSTTQGQTGWYVDVSEELQYWEVTPRRVDSPRMKNNPIRRLKWSDS